MKFDKIRLNEMKYGNSFQFPDTESWKDMDKFTMELAMSDLDSKFKNTVLNLIEKKQFEQALRMAIDFIVKSNDKKMPHTKNKIVDSEE